MMSTALKKADLPFLFNKDHVSFSGGWCWEDRSYWGEAGEVSGIVPPSVKMDLPHGFAQVCNKLAKELMKESIENGTPVNMLLSEYELNGPFRQPDLSDFYVVEYKKAADTGKSLLERQQAHKWIMTYVNKQLDEKAMCERCGKHEHDVTAQFNDEELGKDEQKLCQGCFDEMTAIESAWAFSDWYKHTQQERWSVNGKLKDSLKEGYEAYCEEQGVAPHWDVAEEAEEKLEIGDFVEVVKPFYWYEDDRYEIGQRFVIEKQHINHSFEKWVKKVG